MKIFQFITSLIVMVALLSCGPRATPAPVVPARDDLVDMARARPVPALTQARFHIKLRSTVLDIAGSTGGGLVVERPGHGYLAILGPLGSPLLTASSDGTAVGVMIAKDKRYLIGEDAEEVIAATTAGSAGVDDLLALLTGDLPFDSATITSLKTTEDGSREIMFSGPAGTTVTALLNSTNAVVQELKAYDDQNKLVIEATYGEYKEVSSYLMPSELSLKIPDLDMTIDLRFKTWAFPDSAPDVFQVVAPEGMTEESLNTIVTKLVNESISKGKSEETDSDKK